MANTTENEVSDDTIQRIADELKQRRDEIKLKANLGKAELRDRWETLEDEFSKAQGEFQELRESALDKAHETRLRLKLKFKDLRERYDAIREAALN